MAEKKRVTTETFRQRKESGEKITMITAYDYAAARLVDRAGVDCILVGDSLANVMLGYDSTLPVTMDEMLHHTRAVARGAGRAMVVGDMPFLSYQAGVDEAVRNAGRFLQEAGAAAVKLEGGREIAETVRRIVAAGIPVMGHLGLTPQSVNQFGGYMLRAKESSAAAALIDDALHLAEAGAFAVVLEKIPREVAAAATEILPIPTIGIGSGPDCDGQVLVYHDLLGLPEESKFRFVKRYAAIGEEISAAVSAYVRDVATGDFPAEEHCWRMPPDELAAFRRELEKRRMPR